MLAFVVKPKERASFPTRVTRGNEAGWERVSGQPPTQAPDDEEIAEAVSSSRTILAIKA